MSELSDIQLKYFHLKYVHSHIHVHAHDHIHEHENAHEHGDGHGYLWAPLTQHLFIGLYGTYV
jgi:hypothetical protein